MSELSPLDPEPVGPPRDDRRWLAVPVLVIAFVLVAVVKPWGGPRSADVTPAAPSGIAVVSSAAPVTATASAVTLITDGTPIAAEPIYAHEIESVPWANELAADAGGAWVWSDTGVVRRVATSDLVRRTDLGRPDGAPGPLGSRGIAVAWSQVWASDGAHLGLARLDGDTGAIAQRISLWAADTAATVDAADGSPNDRWASASGFAIDGDSIFLPSIAPRPNDVVAPAGADGQLWRIDTTGTGPATWISIDRPTSVAVGFGSVWVVSCCGDHSDARTYSVVRLDRGTGAIQATITLPVQDAVTDGRPVIRVGPDSVWVGLADLPLIVRIDPGTSSIRSTLPVDMPVTDMAIGPRGSLWVTESEAWYGVGSVVSDRCDGRLMRIDPATERAVAATTMTCPMSVAIAGDNVWVGTAGTEGSGTSGGVPPQLVHLRAIDPAG